MMYAEAARASACLDGGGGGSNPPWVVPFRDFLVVALSKAI